jgi:uncharacterized protein (DUF2344 family)
MKLVLKFMKLGRMAYISHLDLQRAMLRGLRSAGLTPVYSQGFNPHPKLSLALPLSLGFESLCECLEAEIEENARTRAVLSGVARFRGEGMAQALAENDLMKNAAVINILNDALPDGIIVTGAGIIAEYAASGPTGSADSPKQYSLASKVKYAAYDITAPMIAQKNAPADAATELIRAYMAQAHIYTEKENRKKGRIDTIDIRPMIRSFNAERNVGKKARYTCALSASGGTVLNPLLLIQSYYLYSENPVDISEITVVRTKILF